MPQLKRLYASHKDQGLVLLGIHSTRGGEQMKKFVADQKIPWPVAVDVGGATTTAFGVDGFPDYYLIDRAGKLRVADLANGDLERVVKLLLAEKPPKKKGPAPKKN